MTAAVPDVDAPSWFLEPSMGQRLGGAVLDTLVLLPVVLLLRLVLPNGADWGVVVLLRAAYDVALVARSGQTIGKATVHTRVVRLADGSVPSVANAIIRWAVIAGPVIIGRFAAPISPALGLVLLVILLPVLHTPLHRRLHDRAAGTVVTRRR